MKNRNQLQRIRTSGADRPHMPRTGEHCPVSGWWAPLEDESHQQFVTEGSIMPSVNGMPGTWSQAVRVTL